MDIKVILTGATGFVGEGVLLECLENPHVTEILMINRRSVNKKHKKLTELIVPDFLQLDAFSEQLKNYNACFYCAGITSVGISEKKYTVITYDTTIAVANTLLRLNPAMTFCYVSGSHTDSSEKGRVMWARVKGKTENALMKLTPKAYNFRPGGMVASPEQKTAKPVYKLIVRLIGWISPKSINTMKEVGLSMINVVLKGYPTHVLEISDIRKSANGF